MQSAHALTDLKVIVCVVMSSQGIDESALNELFVKGENLLKRTPSGEKKEAVREKHNLLHDKYDTLKVILL